mmetsp:Transcript_102496/g.289484  ORF Transcript_102496/g.289484 Transcript_102496/m.289484 type:complete len:296 (+) Transcript_102496:352-1239(+)
MTRSGCRQHSRGLSKRRRPGGGRGYCRRETRCESCRGFLRLGRPSAAAFRARALFEHCRQLSGWCCCPERQALASTSGWRLRLAFGSARDSAEWRTGAASAGHRSRCCLSNLVAVAPAMALRLARQASTLEASHVSPRRRPAATAWQLHWLVAQAPSRNSTEPPWPRRWGSCPSPNSPRRRRHSQHHRRRRPSRRPSAPLFCLLDLHRRRPLSGRWHWRKNLVEAPVPHRRAGQLWAKRCPAARLQPPVLAAPRRRPHQAVERVPTETEMRRGRATAAQARLPAPHQRCCAFSAR